jgi:hypothetical protein
MKQGSSWIPGVWMCTRWKGAGRSCGVGFARIGVLHKRNSRSPWGSLRLCINLLSALLTIPLVCCHINSFRRASSWGEAMTRRRKEEMRAGLASRGM